MSRINSMNTPPKATPNPKNHLEMLTRYLVGDSSVDHQCVVIAIKSLKLSAGQAENILKKLEAGVTGASDISVEGTVIQVLDKLKFDHRSLFMCFGTTTSYDVAIECLKNIKDNSTGSTVTHFGFGKFGLDWQRYSSAADQLTREYSRDLKGNYYSVKLSAAQIIDLLNDGVKDFSGADLSNFKNSDHSGINFEGVNLSYCNLIGADFDGCNLRGVILTNATGCPSNVKRAKLDQNGVSALINLGVRDFTAVDLSGDLSGINFAGCDLCYADLKKVTGISVIGARLETYSFIDLYKAGLRDFSKVDFSGSSSFPESFQGMDFRGCNLNEANFSNCDLRGAKLTGITGVPQSIAGAILDRYGFIALYKAGLRDFRRVDLPVQDLSRLDLSGIDFSGRNLDGADFYCCNLRDVTLTGITGKPQSIIGAKLDRDGVIALINLGVRDFREVDLSGQDISGVDFSGCDLRGAKLKDIAGVPQSIAAARLDQDGVIALINLGVRDFSGVGLSGQNLSGIDFSGRNLDGADFYCCNLRGANLKDITGKPQSIGAQLDRDGVIALINLGVRDFREVDLSGQDISGVDFSGCDLRGAKLKDIAGVPQSIAGARLDRYGFAALYNAGLRDFSKVDFSGSSSFPESFQGMDFSGCNLNEVNFSNCNLRGAKLKDIAGKPQSIMGAQLDRDGVIALIKLGVRDFREVDLSGQDCLEIDFSGCNLRGAKLKDIKGKSQSLAGAKLDRDGVITLYKAGLRDFSKVDLSGQDISGVDFSGCDLRGAKLKDITGKPQSITGAKLDRDGVIALIKLDVRDFSKVDLSGQDLSEIDFSNCNLNEVNFSNCNLRGAKLKDIAGKPQSITGAKLDRDGVIALIKLGVRDFRRVDLSGQDISGVDLRGCDLRNANLTDVKGISVNGAQLDRNGFTALYNAGLHDFSKVDFSWQDLSGIDFSGCNLDGADFYYCNLRGAKLTGLTRKPKDITGAQLDRDGFAALYNAGLRDFKKVNLSGQDLSGIDFSNYNLNEVNFSNCNLRGAKLTGITGVPWSIDKAKLDRDGVIALIKRGVRDFSRVDLSGQNLSGVDFNGCDLRGATLINATGRPESIRGAGLDRDGFAALYKAGLRDFSKVNFSGKSFLLENFQGMDFSGCNLDGANFGDCNLRGAILNGIITGTSMRIAGAKLDRDGVIALINLGVCDFSGVDLSGQDLTGVNLSKLNLCGANLTNAILTNVKLEYTKLDRLVLDQVVSFPSILKNCELVFGDNLDIEFNHLNNDEGGSILTLINNIDNEQVEIKLTLMEQVFKFLQDKDITSILPALEDILFNSSFDYTPVLLACPKFSQRFLGEIINKANRTPYNLQPKEQQFLIQHLNSMSTETCKTWMLDNNNCFMQLIHQGRSSPDESIRNSVEVLWKIYLEIPHIKAALKIAEPIYYEDANKYRVFNSGDSCLVVTAEYMDKFLYNNSVAAHVSWENIVVTKAGEFCKTDIKNIKLSVMFSLFLANYDYCEKNAKLFTLFGLLSLGASYHDRFMEATKSKSYKHPLITENNEKELKAIFIRFFEQDEFPGLHEVDKLKQLKLKPDHLESIFSAYGMSVADNQKKAKLLLVLSGLFARYSSSAFFGTESVSPEAIRYYAYGLMKAAYQLDSSLFLDRYTDWENRLLGVGSAFTCSAILSTAIIDYCKGFSDYVSDFSGIIPPAW